MKNFIFMLITLTTMSSCYSHCISPPIEERVIFRQGKGIVKKSFCINGNENYTYDIGLTFQWKKPNILSHYFDNVDSLKYAEFNKKFGTTYNEKEKRYIDIGAPVSIFIKIKDVKKDIFILNDKFLRPRTNSLYMGRISYIASKILEPGEYTVYMEAEFLSEDVSESYIEFFLQKTFGK